MLELQKNLCECYTKVLGLEKIRNLSIKHHMADRPTTSRVGRPRSRSDSQTPKRTAKVGRPRSKSVQNPKLRVQARKLLPLLKE